jgi:hypothetical protein
MVFFLLLAYLLGQLLKDTQYQRYLALILARPRQTGIGEKKLRG